MQSEIAIEKQEEQQVTEKVRPKVNLALRKPNHGDRRAWRLAMKTKMPATLYACRRCGKLFVGPLAITCQCPALKPQRAAGRNEG